MRFFYKPCATTIRCFALITFALLSLFNIDSAVATDCTNFHIDPSGVNQSFDGQNSTFNYRVCWNGVPPVLSHWGTSTCLPAGTQAVSASPVAVEIGKDPSVAHKPNAIKWNYGAMTANSCQDFSVTLAGNYLPAIPSQPYVKAGTKTCFLSPSVGPNCNPGPIDPPKPDCSNLQDPLFNPTFLKPDGKVLPDTKMHILAINYLTDQDMVRELAAFQVYIVGGKLYLHEKIRQDLAYPANFIDSLIPANQTAGVNMLPLRDWVEAAGCKIKLVYSTLEFVGENLATLEFDLLSQVSSNPADSDKNFELLWYQGATVPPKTSDQWVRMPSTSQCPFAVDCGPQQCGDDPFFNPNIRYGDDADGVTEGMLKIYSGKYGGANTLVASFEVLVHCGSLHIIELLQGGSCFSADFLAAFLPVSDPNYPDPHGTRLPGVNMASFQAYLKHCGQLDSFAILSAEDRVDVLFENVHKSIYSGSYDLSQVSGTLGIVQSDGECVGDIKGNIVAQVCSCPNPSPTPSDTPSGQPSATSSPQSSPNQTASPTASKQPSNTPSISPSPQVSASATVSPTASSSQSPKASSSVSASPTATGKPSEKPSSTAPQASPSQTASPTASKQPSNSPSSSPSPQSSSSVSASPTATGKPSEKPSSTPPQASPSQTASPTATVKPSEKPSETPTSTPPQASPSQTASPTASKQPSNSPSSSPSPQVSASATVSPTASSAPSPKVSSSVSASPTATGKPSEKPSSTPPQASPSQTASPTASKQPSNTPSSSPSPQSTSSVSASPTATGTPSEKPSSTPPQASPSQTASPTESVMPSSSPTGTASPQASPSETVSPTATEQPSEQPLSSTSPKPSATATPITPEEELCKPNATHMQQLAAFDNSVKLYANRVAAALRSAANISKKQQQVNKAKELRALATIAHEAGLRAWFLTWNGLNSAFCDNRDALSVCINDTYFVALDEIEGILSRLKSNRIMAFRILKPANFQRYKAIKKRVLKRFRITMRFLDRIKNETKAAGRCS